MKKKMNMIKKIGAIATFMLVLSACSIYKPDIQQGNAVAAEAVEQLKQGMTKGEVKTLLGTPLLQDDFHQNRWDYIFYMSKAGKERERKDLILGFSNDRLVSIKKQ